MIDPTGKDIFSKADRTWPPSKIPLGRNATPEANAEAFARDWTRGCSNCAQRPVVNSTGMCGPCTFGEAETAGGNW